MSDKPVEGIRIYGDPVLRKKSRKVDLLDETIIKLIEKMITLLKNAKGIGLSAPQVGENLKIFVLEEKYLTGIEGVKVFINPSITEKTGKNIDEEGCLSFPDIIANIERAQKVKVKATDIDGKDFVMEVSDLYARAVQHENDHLEGVLIVDHLSPLKKTLLGRKLRKLTQGVCNEG